MPNQPSEIDIEQPTQLLQYLRGEGRIGPTERPLIQVLRGGVSNRTVLVQREDGDSWVLKQALEKLRVATDWFSDPRRIHREAQGLRWLAQIAPTGTTTQLVFEDGLNHIIAMTAVPQPHENWKILLLAGRIQTDDVHQFAALLAAIHSRAYEMRDTIAPLFDDRTFFETLRIEPYYRYTASQHPKTQPFFSDLINETSCSRLTIVHGDYSPKNVLVYKGRLILLDHEVIHFGDPAFDIGFSLTHLLSKAHHLTGHRCQLIEQAHAYWTAYRTSSQDIVQTEGFEERAARHTLACLLARVDGRSPLEYLTPAEKQRQREAVLALIESPPAEIGDLIERFQNSIAKNC
jgi:5-methylthioribose kinase